MDTQEPHEPDDAFERVPGGLPRLWTLSEPIVFDVDEIQGCDELLAELDFSRMIHTFGELLRWITEHRRRAAERWHRLLADLIDAMVRLSAPLPEPPEPTKDRVHVRLQPAHGPPAAPALAPSFAGVHV